MGLQFEEGGIQRGAGPLWGRMPWSPLSKEGVSYSGTDLSAAQDVDVSVPKLLELPYLKAFTK